MFEDKIKSKNKLQKRNRRNTNDSVKRKNIFQLIEPVNKKLPLITNKINDPFAFAENLLAFLKEKHFEELEKLSFNPDIDDINILASKLANLAIDLGYTIVFEEEKDITNDIRILYPIRRQDFLLYVFEFCWIDDIVSEELKIGYANLLNVISDYAHLNVFEYHYQTPEDNCFDSEFQWQLEEDMFYDDNNELDEGRLQEANEDVENELKRLRELKEKFTEYIHKPFSIFQDYNPTNDHEIAFKEFLLKGLKLHYSVINKFMPDNDVYEEGGVSFNESMLLFFNCAEGVEAQWMENLNERSNNGWADPMGWYSISDGKVKNMTSKEDIDQLFENFQYFIDLYDKHLNNIKKWNI